MRISLARRRPRWLPSLHDPGPTGLWRIGYALAACFAAAVAGLVVLWVVALTLLNHPHLTQSKSISVHDTVTLAQLVFASVAGVGALVALVMAYRRQRVAEVGTSLDKDRAVVEQERWLATAAHERTRLLNERFAAAAAQLGDDQAAVRLAGVHAMAGLADDWDENRQTCIDVLCAYLRMPYESDPGEQASAPQRLAFRASREVRHTVIRVITAHLRKDAQVSWQGMNFDFTGTVFDGGDFTEARFNGGSVSFDHAEFVGGEVNFNRATFSGGSVDFDGAKFSGAEVDFNSARFSGSYVHFYDAKFLGGQVSFDNGKFSSDYVGFVDAEFRDGIISFRYASFSNGSFDLARVRFSGASVDFYGAEFSGGDVGLEDTLFSGGHVGFRGTELSGGSLVFDRAKFNGAFVDFNDAKFTGSIVDFRHIADWSNPPIFGFANVPPTGLQLPVPSGSA